MKRILLALFAALTTMSSYSQEQTEYTTLRDIPYRTEGDAYALERCRLDIYYPEHVTGRPTVVWFHGGGLTGGSKSIPEQLKRSGYVVVAA
ncbi:MAG: carboxylesterase family protein, partial [Tannerella sp.]|nr:carboxylesterase family protein [Tannerella sp.]